MPLYTFYLAYKGGTYISQIRARTHKLAPKVWAENLNLKEIVGIGSKSKKAIIERLQLDSPILLDGIKNTWCCTALLEGKLALVHFTETVE